MKRSCIILLLGILSVSVLIVSCNMSDISKEQPDRKLIRVGFSQVGAESDWRIANTKSLKSALSVENGFELIYSDAQQKQENQIKAVRDFIAQEVDIIVIAPTVESGWDTVLMEARTAEIPVIIVDRKIKVKDPSLYACWIGSNFEKEGISAAKWLVDFTKNGKKENYNVVVLKGTLGSSPEIGRTKGFYDYIKNYKKFKIIAEQSGEFTQAKAQEIMETYLKKFNSIDVVVAQNDNMAFGAIDALKAEGKLPGKDVIIVSFDGVKAAFMRMIAGEINACVECNPLQGPKVAEAAKKILNGQKIDKYQDIYEGIFLASQAEKELPNRKY